MLHRYGYVMLTRNYYSSIFRYGKADSIRNVNGARTQFFAKAKTELGAKTHDAD